MKFWSKLVHWFKRYRKKKYVGQVAAILFLVQMCFVTVLCITDKSCINLVKFWSGLVHWFKRYMENERFYRALLRAIYRALLRSYSITSIEKMVNLNPVLWVLVWWYANGTGLFRKQARGFKNIFFNFLYLERLRRSSRRKVQKF